MMPCDGYHSKKIERRVGSGLGAALLMGGLIFNYWVIARLLTPDGHIDSTPLQITIWVFDALFISMGAFMLRRPRYAGRLLLVLMPFTALAVFSFLLFLTLELLPGLIKYMPFSHTHYYWLKTRYVADDELVFRTRPLSNFEAVSFMGDLYRESYRANVKPISYRARYDEYGFRNPPSRHETWDVAVLGDSYIEFGVTEADTFSYRLEALSGLRTRNLGTGAYGPFQYVTVLNRYGVTPNLQYALFSFFEGNDISDVRKYLQWRDTGEVYGNFDIPSKNVIQRYFMVVAQVVWIPLTQAIERILGYDASESDGLDADIAMINLGGEKIPTVFSYRNEERPPDELLMTSEWTALKDLLRQFKAICLENVIVPIVMYIPTKAHIYAEYTSPNSGKNWSTIREPQIEAKGNTETTLAILCRELALELVSLTPAFARAAAEGRFLYYAFDTHWNAEGRQVAAGVMADWLSERHATK